MTRIANTNYQASSAVQFEKANSDSDQFDSGDVQKLAEAVDLGDHSLGLGLPVARVAGTSVLPATTDGCALGSGTVMFSDLFLASGGVVNFNNGDITLTHAANNLLFAGASSGYSFDALVAPTTSDGAPLGSTSKMWSDLFLASGAVVNFNNGDVTITHGGNALAFAGASSGYSFDAGVTVSADLVVNKGSDAASLLQVGNGGASPTANRLVQLLLIAPSSVSNLGYPHVEFRRDATSLWLTGVWHSALGVATADTDYVWRPNGDAVMALSQAGVLKTASTIVGPASVTGAATLRIPHGTAPTSPVNGDTWTTSAGFFVRINGVTKTVTLT